MPAPVRTWFALPTLVAAIVAVTPPIASAANTPDVRTEQVSPWGAEPDVDVSASPPRLVLSGITGAVTTSYGPYPAWSQTPGHAWIQGTGIGPTQNGDPNIELDASGNVYLSLLNPNDVDFGGGSVLPRGVLVARSSDGGGTFPIRSYALNINSRFQIPGGGMAGPCASLTGTLYDAPKVATDRSNASPWRDRVYVIARSNGLDVNGQCPSAYVLVHSTAGDTSWTGGVALMDVAGLVGNLAVASNGTLYVADAAQGGTPCGNGSGVTIRKSTDGGTTFQPTVCALDAGTLTAAKAWCAVDPNDPNRVWIAFNRVVTSPTLCQHVYVIASTNGGATWSAPVRVDDMLPDDSADRLYPSISVSNTGRLDVAWFDYRNSNPRTQPADNQPGDVYYSYSTDGGLSWAVSLRLSNGTYPAIRSAHNDFLTVVSSGRKAYVAFAQDSDGNGNHEAYLSTITF